METVTIDFKSIMNISDEQFYQLCRINPDVKFERNAQGEIIIMAPIGGETGRRNVKIAQQLANWVDASGLGVSFDSSTCFKLPNGGDRSPDAAWITTERWDSLTPAQKEKFPPICPDFVLELMSPSDNLKDTRAKMREYQANGARLGWLINRHNKQVEIYRQNQEVEILQSPHILSGEDVLPGFALNLQPIWS
jgi:Uma2 family endonuclease